jgi:hypothetical protein
MGAGENGCKEKRDAPRERGTQEPAQDRDALIARVDIELGGVISRLDVYMSWIRAASGLRMRCYLMSSVKSR